MHMYDILNNFTMLNEKLDKIVVNLKDADDRLTMKEFHAKYEMINLDLKTQCQQILSALVQTLE